MLLILALAAALRGWQLGRLPPGLYRDEAYYGLDALNVLAGGPRPLYFAANNGREPLYVYLLTASITLFGRTPFALRLPAAVIGALTTLPVFALASAWFGRRVGLLSAFLWATTFWPLHLSRIGLRVILLPGACAVALWLLTVAWRRSAGRWRRGAGRWWLAAGLAHGLVYYTYLSVRLLPVFLILFSVYLWWLGRRPSRSAVALFALGTAVAVGPLVVYLAAHPELVVGRTGQVSILNPAINGGDFWGALVRQIAATLGMFIWRGDSIGRHNLPGRPVFDWLMALPFLLGVWYCLRRWRQPAAAACLLWVAVMSAATVLAEDAPHFLRAAGVLPLVLIFPALGLSQLGSWSKLPAGLRALAVAALLFGSLIITVRDYFVIYVRQADTGYLFEEAARVLAVSINADSESGPVLLEKRLLEGWPSIAFLLTSTAPPTLFQPDAFAPILDRPLTVYIWPFEDRAWLGTAWQPPATVRIAEGLLARGDLETQALPLYLRYRIESGAPAAGAPLANFGGAAQLCAVEQLAAAPAALRLALHWCSRGPAERPVKVFVHVVGRQDGRLVGQLDAPPGGPYWDPAWQQPGVMVVEERLIALPEPFDPARHQVLIGAYDDETLLRFPLRTAEGAEQGDSWEWTPPGADDGG